MSTLTNEQLVDLIGTVAAGEYAAARDSAKPKLNEWIDKLRDLTDEELHDEARHAIYESALCSRFTKGNFEDVHCMATATYHEASRRHRLAGHDEDCHGPTIYSRAHAAVMRSHGYKPSPEGTCHCESLKDSQ